MLSVVSLAPGDLLWSPEASDSRSFLLLRYLNNQVFVSLANGELVVYQREAGEAQPPQSPEPPEPYAGFGIPS